MQGLSRRGVILGGASVVALAVAFPLGSLLAYRILIRPPLPSCSMASIRSGAGLISWRSLRAEQ